MFCIDFQAFIFFHLDLAHIPFRSLTQTVLIQSSPNLRNVYWHKMEAKVDNQLNPIRYFEVMALQIFKNLDFVLISGSSIFCIWTLHTLVSTL